MFINVLATQPTRDQASITFQVEKPPSFGQIKLVNEFTLITIILMPSNLMIIMTL